ncbi:hypothetical protein [Planctomycetes bacterium K23_9]|uniref:Uncharacterized protein n=1 Tax=Stieleria marina TaxID=1930275 RepID=A0A517P2M2_9BACT|nr:hypothetical protein K239x_56440 [Planctomycetes bacterium K23_9]
MPTSSENRTPNDLKLEGEHWNELIAVISPKSIESLDSFDEWMSEQLSDLETQLDEFSSRRSIKKSLRG